MGYLMVFSIIIIFSIMLTIAFKKRIEEVLPISVVEIALIIFISGLFDNLSLGIKIIKIVTIVQIFFILFTFLKKKNNEELKEILKYIVTPGLFVYGLLFFISVLINKDRIFEDLDEFTHWGVIIKNMFLYNSFGTNAESVVRFNEYPPFTAVFQYLFLGIKNLYREDTIIIAQNILYFSIMLPITKNIKWNKSLLKLFVIIPVIVFVPIIFYKNFYLDILVDAILGIMFAYLIFSAFEKQDKIVFKYLRILAGGIMLGLTKTTGVGLAILGILIIFIKKIIDCIKHKENSKKELMGIIIVFVIILIVISSWYIKVSTVDTKWDFNKLVDDSGQRNEEILKTVPRFINRIFYGQDITAKCFTVFTTLLLIICLHFYGSNKLKIEGFKYYSIAMLIAIPIWFIGLLISYATIFDKADSEFLLCFDRYTSTILLSFVVFVMLSIGQLEEKLNPKEGIAIVSIILALNPLTNIQEKYLNGKQYITMSNSNRTIYTQLRNFKECLDVNDKVLFIAGKNSVIDYIESMNEYEIMPIRIEQTIKGNFTNLEEFKERIKNFTHVFIYQLEKSENEKIKEAFEYNYIEPYTLYKVKNQNGEIILEMER